MQWLQIDNTADDMTYLLAMGTVVALALEWHKLVRSPALVDNFHTNVDMDTGTTEAAQTAAAGGGCRADSSIQSAIE